MISAKIVGKKLHIEADIEEPTPSSSGKMLLIANTGGFTRTDATFNGQTISMSLNAGFKAAAAKPVGA